MKLEKIKLKNIVKEQLTTNELDLLKGGMYQSGCDAQICKNSKIGDSTQYCTYGDGICKHGIQ